MKTLIFGMIIGSGLLGSYYYLSPVVSIEKEIIVEDIRERSFVYASPTTANAVALWEEEFGGGGVMKALIGDPKPVDLVAHVFEPDDSWKRPAIIYIHGGAFLPGVGAGNNLISSTLGREFAQRGYRFISIDYRSMNIAVPSFLKAGYVAVQDANAALRYIVNHQEELDVDTDQIFLMGVSAGGVTALTAAFLKQGDDIGNREKKLERMYGHLDAIGEPCDVDIKVRGVVSIAGGTHDLNILDDEIPIFLAHGTEDNVIPVDCGSPVEEVSTTVKSFVGGILEHFDDRPRLREKLEEIELPEICGSRAIYDHLLYRNVELEYYEVVGGQHNLLFSASGTAMTNGEDIIDEVAVFLYELN